jgi:hypothetical protein
MMRMADEEIEQKKKTKEAEDFYKKGLDYDKEGDVDGAIEFFKFFF